ncbi:MAG: biotin transporter BioY [Parachlamydiaceae bacterium]|nr:MAG: biotin transporter BioY [Parachlamydiaceae bacterium]
MHQTLLFKSFVSVKSTLGAWAQLLAGSLFIALCAQISLPLPFTPVPLTCQTLAILLLGATLGSKRAFTCTLLYLFEISLGVPFLAGGVIKPLVFLDPTAGYLLGMPLMAYIAGKVSNQKTISLNIFLLSLACLSVLLMGTCKLAIITGWNQAFFLGFYPFIAGEALKVLMVTTYLKAYVF